MTDLLKLDVNGHAERKGNLTYLSWCWAWAEVLKADPEASWELTLFEDANGVEQPCMWLPDGSAMVSVAVTIEGRTRSAVLPVMDNRNQAIKQPNAFAINTAIMRCMTKACAMHGLGLYIYAGEDLPEGEPAPKPATTPERVVLDGIKERLEGNPGNSTPTNLFGEPSIESASDPKWQSWLTLVARVQADPELASLLGEPLTLPIRTVDLEEQFTTLKAQAKAMQNKQKAGA